MQGPGFQPPEYGGTRGTWPDSEPGRLVNQGVLSSCLPPGERAPQGESLRLTLPGTLGFLELLLTPFSPLLTPKTKPQSQSSDLLLFVDRL